MQYFVNSKLFYSGHNILFKSIFEMHLFKPVYSRERDVPFMNTFEDSRCVVTTFFTPMHST